MTDREKVIKKLEECLSASCRGFRTCPYSDADWDAVREALALLKEQIPHIMTYEEVVEYTTGNPYIVQERAPLYVQFKKEHEFTLGWRHAIDIGAMIERRKERGVNDYGRTWVCWTARPTDEQRKAAKWDA